MNTLLKTVIIDDDTLSCEVLKELVSDVPDLELVSVFSDPIEALKGVKEQDIDVLVLDIEMPKMTGLEFISSLSKSPYIILVSSKKEYALDAFDYDVVDYLSKPPTLSRFIKAVDKIKQRIEEKGNNNSGEIFLKEDSQLVKFRMDDFLFFEAYGDYVKAHTKTKFHLISKTLGSVESTLPSQEFQRTHRSYIVRLDKISNIDSNSVLIDTHNIPISNSYREALMKRIQTF